VGPLLALESVSYPDKFSVYTIPGDLFHVPTAYVWILTARLVTGEGLPAMAREWAIGAAALFAATTALRIYTAERYKAWHAMIPGGIAVAVGMYNVPSFTLARAIGGVLAWWWKGWKGWHDTPLIVLASVSFSLSLFYRSRSLRLKVPAG